jgi:hypothetical protein
MNAQASRSNKKHAASQLALGAVAVLLLWATLACPAYAQPSTYLPWEAGRTVWVGQGWGQGDAIKGSRTTVGTSSSATGQPSGRRHPDASQSHTPDALQTAVTPGIRAAMPFPEVAAMGTRWSSATPIRPAACTPTSPR